MAFREVALADIAENFDAFLIDQFGVLLNGPGVYPGAAEALSSLAELGKPILLLSNSGKRSGPNERRLVDRGFARKAFRGVLSSGEAAHFALQEAIGNSLPTGAKVFLIARDGDRSAIEGLDLVLTDRISEAELLLIAASEAEQYSLEHYEALLKIAAANRIPCWCTNPDQTMLTGAGRVFGAGRIASLYEELGGTVLWFGKPYPLIYDIGLRMLGGVSPERVLCIGDSPQHDIVGGQDAGCATALVRTGIHEGASMTDIRKICAVHGAEPDFVFNCFSY
jgi:HAD superfamily hydrolase (TIGR01459 family)